jgi:hypothetical protein
MHAASSSKPWEKREERGRGERREREREIGKYSFNTL